MKISLASLSIFVVVLALAVLTFVHRANTSAEDVNCSPDEIPSATPTLQSESDGTASGQTLPISGPVETIVLLKLFVSLDGGFPRLEPTVVIHLPAARVAQLQRLTPAEVNAGTFINGRFYPNTYSLELRNYFRNELWRMLNDLFNGDQDTVNSIVNAVQETPRIAVSGGMATVILPLPDDLLLESYPPSTRIVAAPWFARQVGRDLEFGIEARARNDVVWDIEICVDGMQLQSANPIPTSTDAGWARWVLGPNSRSADPKGVDLHVSARYRPEPATAVQLWLFDPARRNIAFASTYLLPILPVFACLWLIPRQRIVSVRLNTARTRLRTFALASLGLVVAGILALGLLEYRTELATSGLVLFASVILVVVAAVVLDAGWTWTTVLAAITPKQLLGLHAHPNPAKTSSRSQAAPPHGLAPLRLAARNWPYVALIAAVVSVLGYQELLSADQRDQWEEWAPSLQSSLFVLAHTSFVAAAWLTFRRSRLAVLLILGVGALGFSLCLPAIPDLAAAAFPLWITACALVGLILFVLALWPDAERQLDRGWRRVAVSAGTATIVIAIYAQWGKATYGQRSLWSRAPFEAAPVDLAGTFINSLQIRQSSLGFVLGAMQPVSLLLMLVGTVGAAGALRAAEGRGGPFWPQRDRWIRRMILLVFGVAVVGYSGDVFGLRLPIAFLFALVIVQIVLSNDLAEASTKIDTHNSIPEVPEREIRHLLLVYRKQLFLRAKAVEDLGRRSTQSQDSSVQAPTYSDYGDQRDALQAEIAYLEYGINLEHPPHDSPRGKRQPILKVPPELHVSARRLAFAPGPIGDWWDNASLATRLGARLALIPVAFFVYVVATNSIEEVIASNDLSSAVWLFATFVMEIAFWIGAAFTLGALYPYVRGGNGVIKGALLAAVYFGAHAAAWVVIDGDHTPWLVKSLQLLLFLTILGAWLDLKALKHQGLDWRLLGDYYELRDIRVLLAYLSPLVVTLFTVGQQLYSGQAQDAVIQIIKVLPQLIAI